MANMIFQHTWEKVIAGEKTQTRRIVKPGQRLVEEFYDWPFRHVYDNNDRLVYATYTPLNIATGRYAVMPARGVRGLRKVADIEITRIRREDIREISEADAIAEGFALCPEYSFWRTWCKMHDVSVVGQLDAEFEYWENPGNYHPDNAPSLNGLCRGVLRLRPAELYTAWALDFRVVNVYDDAVAKARELLKAA
jgi:hypothetical protein